MKAIGIRELKAQLSHVLRDVARGDTFLVTDRGRVVAELRRPDPDGALRLAERPSSYRGKSPLASPGGSANQPIDDARDETKGGRRRDLGDIAGQWCEDPDFDQAIVEQDSVDPSLWR